MTREMIACEACGDSGIADYRLHLALSAAVDDALDRGVRLGLPDVAMERCESCPRGRCCGRTVAEHSDAELRKRPAPTHVPGVWDVPGCSELRPPLFVDARDAEHWIKKQDCRGSDCEAEVDEGAWVSLRCRRHRNADEIAWRLFHWQRRQRDRMRGAQALSAEAL